MYDLIAESEAATEAHAEAAAVYHEALSAREKINVRVRETCDVASKASAIMTALKKAVEALPPAKPTLVEGEGTVEILTADDVAEVSAADLGVEGSE